MHSLGNTDMLSVPGGLQAILTKRGTFLRYVIQTTDNCLHQDDALMMADQEVLRIQSADRFSDSIIIGFSNGRCGRYSASLLYAMLAQGEELVELGSGQGWHQEYSADELPRKIS